MGLIEKDGFKFFDGNTGEVIAVESDKINNYVKYICDNDIRAVAISSQFYKLDNFEFIKECSFIEKLSLNSKIIEDFSSLNYLENLKELMLDEPKEVVEVSKFKHLANFTATLNKNVVGISDSINLKVLRLWKYKPISKNLNGLSKLMELNELSLTQSSINSLQGCENLPKLKKMELYYLNKLESIEEISTKSDVLEGLFVESCKNIKDYNAVSALKNLEKLSFIDCGDIPSLSFIKEMPRLKSFVFMGSNVVDGDISYCKDLEYVAFNEKRHYSHKLKDLR